MMRRRQWQLMLRTMNLVHPLIVTGLVLHRRTYALIAVAVILLPFRCDKSLLRRVREARGMLGPESLLGCHRAASGRRGDHVAVLADADGDVADVDRDLATLGIAKGLRQRPDVIVRETERFYLCQFRVFGKRRQGHSQAFQSVI